MSQGSNSSVENLLTFDQSMNYGKNIKKNSSISNITAKKSSERHSRTVSREKEKCCLSIFKVGIQFEKPISNKSRRRL